MDPRTIARRRVAVSLTQAQLAHYIGKSRTWVMQVEAGHLGVTQANATRLERVFTILEHAHEDARRVAQVVA